MQDEQETRERIVRVIQRIRPAIQADGGDVEFVDLEDGVVQLRLMGACVGCPMSTMTLQAGIERLIRQEVPDIKGVMSV
ncbi:MAG TPA: NifU family protein [Bacillota bacterium]